MSDTPTPAVVLPVVPPVAASSVPPSTVKPTLALPFDLRLMRSITLVLFGLVVVALVAAAALWGMRSSLFTVRSLDVRGHAPHHTAASLQDYAVPRLVGNYFSMDLKAARAVFESIPWIRRATVSRVWPNRLAVTLEEYEPVALWERDEGDDLLVDAQGRIFEVNMGDVDDEGMVSLRGPQGAAPEVLAMWHAMAPVLKPLGSELGLVALSDRGSWRVELRSGPVLELGRGSREEVLARSQRFAQTIGQLQERFQRRAVEYADLRHNEGFAVRLVGMGTTTVESIKRKTR
jgi:cell division protein FtsQ